MGDPEILSHYESIREEDRLASGMGRLELLRTQEVLDRHLPPPPASVLDVGGGTGTHAAWLVAAGYTVHVIDLAPRHIELVRASLGVRGVTAEVGDARSLAAASGSYDVVLLLGPLYHLVERSDRIRALAEGRRVMSERGILAAGAISRFASLFDGLARGFLFDPEFKAIVEGDLRDGQHRNPENKPHWFTTAYFHRPSDLAQEVREAGLHVRELVGLEGLAGWMPDLADRLSDELARQEILYSARAIESEEGFVALSGHMLLVADAS
jgi:SAM-dependent methyltransferase